MYAYAEPTSEAEMIARYADIRRRTFGTRPAKKAVPPKPKQIASLHYLCQRDAHVTDYRLHLRMKEAEEAANEERVKFLRTNSFRAIAEDILSAEPEFKWADIIGKSRKVAVVRLRDAILFVAKREDENRSLPMLGRLCGGRDHTTVLHSIRKVDQAIKTNDGVWRRTATGRAYFLRNIHTAHYGRGKLA